MKDKQPPEQRKEPPLDTLNEIVNILGKLTPEERTRVVQTVCVFFSIYVPNN